MLVLSRRAGESLVIGHDTILTVNGIVGLTYVITVSSPSGSFRNKIFHAGDCIRIGPKVSVYLYGSRYKANEIRCNIDAPREIPVDRGEVWLRKYHPTWAASLTKPAQATLHRSA